MADDLDDMLPCAPAPAADDKMATSGTCDSVDSDDDSTDEGDEDGGEGLERDSPASPVPEAGQEREQGDGQEKVKQIYIDQRGRCWGWFGRV